MKVLLAVHGFPPETSGGTENAVEALARGLQRANCEVTVLAGSLRQGDPATLDEEDHAGLRVLRLHRDDLYYESWFKAHSPAVSAACATLLATLRPDVVHVHHWLRLTSDLARLARAARAVVAVTCHDYFAPLARPVRRIGEDAPVAPGAPAYVGVREVEEAFALHRADFIDELRAAHIRFAPSRAQADGVAAAFGADLGGPFVVAPPPPLHAPLRPVRRPGQRRLVTWGSVYPEKGLASVLEALARAPGWTLDVYGAAHDPAFAAELERRAAGLPVTFHGAFDASALQAVAADFALLPSLAHESYGFVLDEALQLGLPVIAADVPAYRERAPRHASVFYPAGDATALARILADAAALDRLAVPAPLPAHDVDALAASVLAEYRAAVPQRGAPYAASVTDGMRARHLFRRAERRLWSALRLGAPTPPPDDFLASGP